VVCDWPDSVVGAVICTTQKLGELQQAFVDALRSGEFDQCKGVLHDGRGYCCLGVACVIARGSGAVEPDVVRYAFDVVNDMLPDAVKDALQFRSECGEFHHVRGGLSGYVSLTHMNDEERSFAEIADRIEQYPSDVFWEAR